MNKRILPIVVIYCCELKDSTAYQTMLVRNGITEFVVYDNSPSDYQQPAGSIPEGAHYFHDVVNGGLSKAYNYGAKKAQELGYDWVLLLDQDTEFPEGAWAIYQQTLGQQQMLVPNVVLANGQPFSPSRPKLGGMVPLHLEERAYALKDYTAINSGCCVPLDLYTAAGGYKDDVRLDFSDYQFQRRLRQVSTSFYVLPLTVRQDFSNDETNIQKLQKRFLLYLDGARHCEISGFRDRLDLHLQVLKHSLALSARTRKMNFIVCYFKKYLLHR